MASKPASKEVLEQQVAQILASDVLGKSEAYPKLLTFLAERVHTGRAVKEIEIAIEVLGRDETFDATQDSLVRVYIHKLRERLDRYYATEGKNFEQRLQIPKGSYVLTLEDNRPKTERKLSLQLPPYFLATALAGILLGVAASLIVQFNSARNELAQSALASPIWSVLLDSDKPVLIVMGEVFLYSEVNEEFAQLREIRDFSIHSASQFETLADQYPAMMMHYRDFGARYQPTGSSDALAALIPMLDRYVPWQLTDMSDLANYDISAYNLIYVGLFTGLGTLQNTALQDSGFSLHPNGAVLIDLNSGEVFASEGQPAEQYRDRYIDYALFTRHLQENGTWLFALMSARNAGLAHLTQFAASASGAADLGANADGAFEVLLEISGTGSDDLQTQVRTIRQLPD